jgi:thiamine kinase-like enzyme
MTFLLSSKNVFEYLCSYGFCSQTEEDLGKVESKSAKNFNLRVELPDRSVLVKQEPHNKEGKTAGEFLREWRIQEFIQQIEEVSHLSCWLPQVLHFNSVHSIVIVHYLDDYQNLAADFYGKEQVFPIAIARSIGYILADFHRTTLDRSDYREFFTSSSQEIPIPPASQGLGRISPKVFGEVPAEGLKFLALYQRFDSLGKAIAELNQAFEPCCLTHNDFKLNNILLPKSWEQTEIASDTPRDTLGARDLEEGIIALKLIDWERSAWGDPAADLGMLIASYLIMWLQSLVASKSMAIEESLRMAMIPLEQIQPSTAALMRAYLQAFPQILQRRPDFLKRAMQFTGMSLIQSIQATLQYQKSFNNTGICILQVAKALLCRPETSIPTILGADVLEFMPISTFQT